jgi:tryptophan synthase beta chain
LILVNLSGRGDKDVDTAIKWFGLDTAGTASESSDLSASVAAMTTTDADKSVSAPTDSGPQR